jgi:6-phosphogluconolactonase (cycloisomerase 2 family)
MNRFGSILCSVAIVVIGVALSSLVWTEEAFADGNGELTFVEFVKDSVVGIDGLGRASSVTVSPDGKHIYAAGNIDHAVAVFSRDSATGQLTFVEV